MTGFLGEYEVAMDTKGRFLMPAGFRKQLPEEGELRFVVSRGLESFLTLYTMQDWEQFTAKLSKLNELNTKAARVKRLLMGGATIVELDSAGRMLLPKSLQEYAGMKRISYSRRRVTKLKFGIKILITITSSNIAKGSVTWQTRYSEEVLWTLFNNND